MAETEQQQDSPEISKQKSAPKMTPMMERYLEVKAQNPGSLLLFRMGDFYELFYEDAEVAARTLGLTLTSRDKGSSHPIAMAGFPYHALDGYLQKLIRAGHRAAICEQMEDPKQAKGLVKREVTRIVTPGTLTEDSLLDPASSNYLAAYSRGKQHYGLAWLELSTGRFQVSDCVPENLLEELVRIDPVELIISDEGDESEHPLEALSELVMTRRPPWSFLKESCQQRLFEHFRVRSLDGFDIPADSESIIAAGVLLEYVQETQKTALDHMNRIERFHPGDAVRIDEATRRSLELTHTLRTGQKQGSLLQILDKTRTPMGARLLAEWIHLPLTSRPEIEARATAVEQFTTDPALLENVRSALDGIYDLQRLTARVATGRCNPRDISFLGRTLAQLPRMKSLLVGRSAPLIRELEERIDLCGELRSRIDTCLEEDPPFNLTDGNVIRAGFNEKLDELRSLSRGGKEWIAAYQKQEIERTGITNLKVGFNKVFGYYLEVTAAQMGKVPQDYIRKQTLKNQERFITPELKEYEEKVLTADQRALALESELFQELREEICQHLTRFQTTAQAIAELDVLACLAQVAINNRYCRPELCDAPILDIREGRHPVLDVLLPAGEFVPNDIFLGRDPESDSNEATETAGGLVQLITGPNMAGKSTYIRQAALITLLAQMGSFVPASEARIGIVDRIFARVGASDELSRGQSTFMVEMTETARILNSATEKSLIVLDEIGRGTSTFDGLSLAWAITEYLHDVTAARTMFATHYHELTELANQLNGVRNWNVAVYESDGDIHFLHKIVPGAANKSYGIHVARLAGVPTEVLTRATQLLQTLETRQGDSTDKMDVPARQTDRTSRRQLNLFEPAPHPVLESLERLDLDSLSPKAALDQLYQLRQSLLKK